MNSLTSQKIKKHMVFAAITGLLCVALGAFGAHALKDTLAILGHTETWKTAVQYAMFHTIAILAICSLYAHQFLSLSLTLWILRLWSIGILLFSGSLFGLSLQGGSWLGPITPLGGSLFILGWLLLAIALLKPHSEGK